MTTPFLLALALLLAPVPLAYLVPPAPNAHPDPWKIRRLRRTVSGFAVLVAVMYLLANWSLPTASAESPLGSPWVTGVLLWSLMAWFFFAALWLELRRPRTSRFLRRSASLRPRDNDAAVPIIAWWLLALAWAVSLTLFISWEQLRGSAWTLLGSCVVLLLLGPVLARRQLVETPEPRSNELSEDLAARLEAAYRERRRFRGWALFGLVVMSITYKTWLAVLLADPGRTRLALPLLGAAALVLLVFLVIIAGYDRSMGRRTTELRSGHPFEV